MGLLMGLVEQIDRFLDHVFHRANGSHVGLVTARGAHQVHHIFGGVDVGKGYVSFGVRVGITANF